jgi:ABC-2 type transport system ATP-binding protein
MADNGPVHTDLSTRAPHDASAHVPARTDGSLSPQSGEPAVRITGVSKRFGSNTAVRELDLIVPTGSLCGFLGPNGAGKSTTIRMILSIIYPDAGTVEVLGSSALAQKDRIGYLPEERGLYRKMRVADYLKYIARLKSVTAHGLNERVTQWLERMDLPGVEQKKCEELSKGMQQKVQIIASIIHEPELLVLDEPFSGLDPVNAELMINLLRELNDNGKTIIFSTHVLHQAEQICDRIFLINKGVKLLDATLEEIRVRFDPRTVAVELANGGELARDIPGVRHVLLISGSAAYELELDQDADAQDVMRRVMERHAIRSIALRRVSLTEVFVRLVQQHRGEAAAELAREELAHV